MGETILRCFYYAFVFLLGMCIFSFLNVLIYRLPRKIQFRKGRSFCPSCNHNLSAIDMVPVLSYLFLGRKCRYCKEKISPRYAIVELIGGFSSLLAFTHYFDFEQFIEKLQMNGALWFSLLQTFFVLILFSFLTVVAYIDFDTMEISNGASLWALVMGVLSMFILNDVSVVDHIIGFFVVSVPLYVITMIIPDAFGGGDIKLMFGLGGLLGWKLALLALFIGIVSGGIFGALVLMTKKMGRKDHFAFGPFLCAGTAIALLWGTELLNWYFGMYL